jgi:molecular chaperone IbpA
MNKTMTLFDSFFHNPIVRKSLIGDVDSMFDTMSTVANNSFIPWNIIRTSDNTWVIECAVAGYGKEDLKIEMVDNLLKISGNRKDYAGSKDNWVYEHRGISMKNFILPITIMEGVKVGNAGLKDGMLRIVLERVENPMKLIPITDEEAAEATVDDKAA